MKKILIVLALIFLIALAYRFRTQSTPFWVDEFSSAAQARLLLKSGVGAFFDNTSYFEVRSLTTYGLVAASFSLFGQSEAAARYPFMIIGASVVVLIYLFAKKVSDTTTAVCAAMLTTTSYYMITWSSQARSYPLLQALVIIFFLVYMHTLQKILAKKPVFYELLALGFLIALGTLTHVFFFCAVFACFFHFVFSAQSELTNFLKKNFLLLSMGTIFLGVVLIASGVLAQLFQYLQLFLKGPIVNNLWYYHSFLWREHTLETFLGLIGLALLSKKLRRYGSLPLIFTVLQIVVLSFGFKAYVSRYLVAVFPFLFIGMAYAVTYFVQNIWQQELKGVLPRLLIPVAAIGLCAMIVLQGDKFTVKPKPYYSLNHDFREVALLDYNKVYERIRQRGQLEKNQTAVIDTWPDRLSWYLGESYQGFYVYRWSDAGFMKKTPYTLNQAQEKTVTQRAHVVLISELSDLKKAMSKYQRGFLWIDDTTLPADVREYAKKNLHVELFLDHYDQDDNPYSLWPGTLYSWGVESGQMPPSSR